MTSLRRLDELRAQARYHRERRDLYRAKMHGPRPTSSARRRELELGVRLSELRLRRAERREPSPRYLTDLQACNVGRVNADRTIGAVLGEPGETRLT